MTKDGGPAFPYGGIHINGERLAGMSLRDYFAAAALSGMFSTPGSHLYFENAATEAYRYADAMLKAREQT